MTKPIGWKFRVEVPDCAAADVADVVGTQVQEELARAQKHVEVPDVELARVKMAVEGGIALVKRHPKGKAELELVEAADGRVQATVHHESGHASGTLVIVPPLDAPAAASPATPTKPAATAASSPASATKGAPSTSPAGPGLQRTGRAAKPFVPVASRIGGDNPTGGGPAAPRN